MNITDIIAIFLCILSFSLFLVTVGFLISIQYRSTIKLKQAEKIIKIGIFDKLS